MCLTNMAFFSLSDEEVEEPKAPTSPSSSPGQSWTFGCTRRLSAVNNFSNIAGGLRLAHTHTIAVAGVVANLPPTAPQSSPPPASPFRRGERASFHGRGSARLLTLSRFNRPTPSSSVTRPKLPSIPSTNHQRTLPNVPPPQSTLSAKASAFLSKDSQLLSVKTLLQQVASISPRAVLASLSPRPCHRFLPRPPIPQSQSHPNLHSSSSSLYSSTESVASQSERPHMTAKLRAVANISEISSVTSETASGKIRVPQHSPVYELHSQINPKHSHKRHKGRLIRPVHISRLSNHSDCCHFFNRPTHICRYQDIDTYNSPPPPAPYKTPVESSPMRTTTPVEDLSTFVTPDPLQQTPTYPFTTGSTFTLSCEATPLPDHRTSSVDCFKEHGSSPVTPQLPDDTDIHQIYFAPADLEREYEYDEENELSSPKPQSAELPYHLLQQYIKEEQLSQCPTEALVSSPRQAYCSVPLYSCDHSNSSIGRSTGVPDSKLSPVNEDDSKCSKGALEWDEDGSEAVSKKFAALFTQDLPCSPPIPEKHPNLVAVSDSSSQAYSTSVILSQTKSSSAAAKPSVSLEKKDVKHKRKDHQNKPASDSSNFFPSKVFRFRGSTSSSSLMSLSLR